MKDDRSRAATGIHHHAFLKAVSQSFGWEAGLSWQEIAAKRAVRLFPDAYIGPALQVVCSGERPDGSFI